MMKGPIYLALSLIANIALAYLLSTAYVDSQECIRYQDKNNHLRMELSTLRRSLQEKTDDMSLCVKAAIGVESGFDPLYHSVEDASLMEVTIYSDTESGEPRKFVIQGCRKEDGK